jgi:hypothetical protein
MQTGLAGVTHIGHDKDYSALIKAALELEGWTKGEHHLPDDWQPVVSHVVGRVPTHKGSYLLIVPAVCLVQPTC